MSYFIPKVYYVSVEELKRDFDVLSEAFVCVLVYKMASNKQQC